MTRVALAVFALLGILCLIDAPYSVQEKIADNKNEFITWEELAQMPGPQSGYGLTVFKGTKVEKFYVEFESIGEHPIIRNEKVIWVRMGRPLLGSQVLGGMSGSTVYFKNKNGQWKILGAMAFGSELPVTGKSIGGITPIDAIINQRKTDSSKKPQATREIEEEYVQLLVKNLRDPASQRRLNDLRSRMIAEMAKPIPVGTYNGQQIMLLQPAITVSSASTQSGKKSYSLQKPKPGDAVTMMMVDGDISLGATCTVTYVTENKFWACGHPILMDGQIIAPARISSIATSYKGPFKAFKMVGEHLASAGYISYDGPFAIEGTLAKPPENSMLPVSIKVDLNGKPVAINYEVFRHRLYSAALVAEIGSQSLEPLWNPKKKATTTAKSIVYYDEKSINLYESSSAGSSIMFGPFVIPSDPWSAVGRTAQVAGSLLSSEWNFDVKKIEINIRLKEGENALQLDSLKILNSKNEIIDTASPGEDVQLLIALRTKQGTKNFLTKIPFKIPEMSEIKKDPRNDDGPAILISVESGNSYNERDEKKVRIGIPENKDIFVHQLMLNERDPQKIFIQMILPPTSTTSKPPQALEGDYKNSWQKVPTLNFLQSASPVERKIIRAEISSPIPGSVLNVNGTVRLNLNIQKIPQPQITPDKE